jgi:hypothetical protein
MYFKEKQKNLEKSKKKIRTIVIQLQSQYSDRTGNSMKLVFANLVDLSAKND